MRDQTEDLEELRPTIEAELIALGLSPAIILRNTNESPQAEVDAFNRLNDPGSPHRVILLVNKGTEGWNCKSLFACALARRAHLLAEGFRGKVNLVSIDPPFDSGADSVRKVSLRGPKGTAKLDGESYTLGEIQYTDIRANDNYLQFMYERLMLLRSLLADVPEKKTDLVSGAYELPAPKGKTTVAVKIIDVLGEEVLVTASA